MRILVAIEGIIDCRSAASMGLEFTNLQAVNFMDFPSS